MAVIRQSRCGAQRPPSIILIGAPRRLEPCSISAGNSSFSGISSRIDQDILRQRFRFPANLFRRICKPQMNHSGRSLFNRSLPISQSKGSSKNAAIHRRRFHACLITFDAHYSPDGYISLPNQAQFSTKKCAKSRRLKSLEPPRFSMRFYFSPCVSSA